MRNKNTHSLTIKKKLKKSRKLFCAYSELQLKYGERLDENNDIVEIRANVNLEGFDLGESFTSDFVCTKQNGELMVRECTYKKHLLRPTTLRQLDASRSYWLSRNVEDWGIVLDA